jgi:hypothetical protein
LVKIFGFVVVIAILEGFGDFHRAGTWFLDGFCVVSCGDNVVFKRMFCDDKKHATFSKFIFGVDAANQRDGWIVPV